MTPATGSIAPPPSVDIVIVTYQSRDLVRECLTSIRSCLELGDRICVHVSDNASVDGTVEMIRDEFPDVRVTARRVNDGFGAANNEVLRTLSGDYVLLLNPDTRLESDVVTPLCRLMDAHPTLGLVGCRLILNDGSFDHAAKRSFPTPADSIKYMMRRRGTGTADYLAPEVAEDGSGPVDAVNGAFMLLRQSAVREVGFFDEDYWMYGEDLDLAKRLRLAGWSTWYEGSHVVRHVKGGVSGRWRKPALNYQFHRSMAIYYRKFHSGDNRLLDAAVYTGIAAKFAVSTAVSMGRRGVERVMRDRT